MGWGQAMAQQGRVAGTGGCSTNGNHKWFQCKVCRSPVEPLGFEVLRYGQGVKVQGQCCRKSHKREEDKLE